MRSFVLAIVTLAIAAPCGARHGAPPASSLGLTQPAGAVDTLRLPPVDTDVLRAEDETRRGGPHRFAAPLDVMLTPAERGTWEVLADGSRLWRLRVVSPGATDLNFGFGRYELPEGASLHVLSESTGLYEGPYTDADNKAHGELWTPVVPGDSAVIELRLPPGTDPATLELRRIGHGYRDFHRRLPPVTPPVPQSGGCNVDVVCPQGDPWRDEIRSVAVYSVFGFLDCTGVLLVDVPRTFRPWFLTADHCGVDPGAASSVVVYWNWQSPTCRGPRADDDPPDPNPAVVDNQTGATWRATENVSDFTLLELDQRPDPSFNVYHAGWDRSGRRASGTVTIHHPNVDYKAISFNDDPVIPSNNCNTGDPAITHWEVDNYEEGTTELGSSGCPLFDASNHLVIGTLTGGLAQCGILDFDCYGQFAMQWNGAGTPDSRLSDWLDPAGTGTTTMPGANPGVSLELVSHSGTDSCAYPGLGGGNGLWEPGESIQVPVTLRANGPLSNVQGTLTTTSPGVMIVDGAASWPNLATGTDTQSTAPHFTIQLDPMLTVCDALLEFELAVTATGGGPWNLTFSRGVGGSQRPNVPVAILDNATVTSTLEVSDAITLSDVDARVRIDHTYVGDLILVLESPAGTRVVLLDRPGVPVPDDVGCSDRNMDVTFDDDSTAPENPLEAHCMGNDPWYVGDALPVEPLAALAGESARGTWRLHVGDNAGGDTGTILDWGLTTVPPLASGCTVCEDASGCPGQEMAVRELRVSKGAAGSVVLTFPPAPSPCALGVQVRRAASARPTVPPGSFPTDPAFTDVTSQDMDAGPAFRHVPPGGNSYYLVVESLPGGLFGPSGHYGN